MFFLRSMVGKFVFWSLVLLALVAFTGIRAIWNNQNSDTHDWTYWQTKYKDVAYKITNDSAVKEAIQNTPLEVKQVTVTQFTLIKQDGTTQQRVDRCQSCHIGLENPQMTAENIIKVIDGVSVPTSGLADYLQNPSHHDTLEVIKTLGAHPGVEIDEAGGKVRPLGILHGPSMEYGIVTAANLTAADRANYANQQTNLKQHPFPTFGCTTCHNGSGRELIQEKAHGDPEHWLSPMLPAKYMQAACAQCHASYNSKTFSISYVTPGGAPMAQLQTIARGAKLFKQQACYGCHKIDGFSKGNIGPELTYEGRTTLYESIEHQLWDPRYKVGACIMPYFFAVRARNTDDHDPTHDRDVPDPRAKTVEPADIESKAIRDTLRQHGYIADKSRQADVDALVTFIVSQTGQNYADSQASRFSTIAAYNNAVPPDVPVTVAEGKRLFEQSGCYACHYIGQPNRPHITGDPKFGRGGVSGPELSWEGARHSRQWMNEHYKSPQEFVPGSIMPIFPLSNTQRAALSLFDASHRPARAAKPTVSPDQDMPTAAQQTQHVQTRDIRYMTR